MGEPLLDRLGLRLYLTRIVQFFLGFDGLLHGLGVLTAYYEEAWTTFALNLFHTSIFVIAVYFVGHDHSHHQLNEGENHEHNDGESENPNRIRNIVYVVLAVFAILFLTPIGEMILPESLHLIEHNHEH